MGLTKNRQLQQGSYSVVFDFDLVVDLVERGLVHSDVENGADLNEQAASASVSFFTDLSDSLVDATSQETFVEEFATAAIAAYQESGGSAADIDLESIEAGENNLESLSDDVHVEVEIWERPSESPAS